MLQIAPEPVAKRAVEDNLGVYVNARNMVDQLGAEQLSKELGLNVTSILANYQPIPRSSEQFTLTHDLTQHAASITLQHHCGKLRYTYGANGRVTYADGKYLTKVKYLVATGGALTRLSERSAILDRLRSINAGGKLLYHKAEQRSTLQDR